MDRPRLSRSRHPHLPSRQARVLLYGRFMGRRATGRMGSGRGSNELTHFRRSVVEALAAATACLLVRCSPRRTPLQLFRRRRRRNARITGLRRFHVHQLHFENQGRIRWNSRSTLLAVGEIRRDEKLELGADLHQLEGLGPAFDDTANWKHCRLTAFIRTVEFSSIRQRAAVIDRDGVATFRLRATAFFQYFVLQTAPSRFDTFVSFCCISFSNAVIVSLTSCSLRSGFLPDRASLNPAVNASWFTSTFCRLKLKPTLRPMA